MRPARILVAGIGNIFLGDDGFGVEVARRLAGRPLPAGVRVADFGIRGLDLAFALLEGYDATILVDAAPRGRPPGTLYVLALEPAPATAAAGPLEPHGMHVGRVLELVRAMGGEPDRLRLVGCEPATLGGEDGAMGLSAPVAAAVDPAVALVEEMLTELRREAGDRA
jgi:hydrogenase maturation protease